MPSARLLLLLTVISAAPAYAEARETVYDLLRLGSLIERSEGVVLGFGHDGSAPVVGGFNTGFRLRQDGALQAHGAEAELLVPLARDRAYRVIADLVARRAGPLALFADGRLAGRKSLRAERQSVTFEIPAARGRSEESFLTFAFHGRRRVRGRLSRRRLSRQKITPEPLRATFERIEIRPVAPGAERTLRFYVQVPNRGELVAKVVGEGRVAVRVDAAAGDGREVLSRAVAGDAEVQASLEAFAGKVVRLTLTSAGSAAWKEARLVAPTVPAPSEPAFRPRNVVLWVIDTLRADKLGCYNPRTRVRTPNFDAFARKGVLFRKPIAQSSHSKPASASILTGHYSASHGGNLHKDKLKSDVPLLSELFQAAGFATAAFAANGFIGKPHGFARGWDTFRNLLREGRPAKTPYLFHPVKRWLLQKRDKPFFLYVHSVDPHVPYNPPRQFLSLYWQGRYRGRIIPRRSGYQLDDARAGKFRVGPKDRLYAEALYDGEVTVADHWFGKFLDLLEENGLDKDTLLVVTSDHGEEFWDHGHPGHGHTVYNELVRVPFVLGPVPGALAGRVVESDVELVDLAPTILDLAGLPIPPAIQGRSLVPWIRAEPSVRGPAFSVHEGRIGAAQAGRWKYILYRGGAERVFDLETDPGERRDVAGELPIVRRYLRGLFALWLQKQGSWRKARDGSFGQPR